MKFDSVAISSFLKKFYGIDFVSKLSPYQKFEKFDFFLVQKCWEINLPTTSILLDDDAYCDVIMTSRYGSRHLHLFTSKEQMIYINALCRERS